MLGYCSRIGCSQQHTRWSRRSGDSSMTKQLGIMNTQIRRIRADEWSEMRSLRLHALADAPTAYGSTLALEQSYSEEVWRERSLGTSSGCERATFVAERDGTWIGMVTGLANQQGETKQSTLLVAMFVATFARREGTGVALVDALTSWARDCGASQIALWVTSDNNPAVSLYQRCGFRLTGVSKSHAHAPGLTEREMVRRL
jgi:GNAT superfamily N-acetyltransferase